MYVAVKISIVILAGGGGGGGGGGDATHLCRVLN